MVVFAAIHDSNVPSNLWLKGIEKMILNCVLVIIGYFYVLNKTKELPLKLAQPPVKNIFCAKRSCSSDENCLST